jgi:hypothetical protein
LFLQSPTPPQYVFWYHNDKMVNYDAARGGVTADTGNYTCRAPNTDPDTIHVFVSKGTTGSRAEEC